MSFLDAGKREASIRTPDARVRARRPEEMTSWPEPEAQATKPGGWPAHFCGAAGMAGERPGSRAPASTPPASQTGLKPAHEPIRPHAWACFPGSWPRRVSQPASHPSHLPKHLWEHSWEAPSYPTPCSATTQPGREGCSQDPRSGSTPAGERKAGLPFWATGHLLPATTLPREAKEEPQTPTD